MARAHALAAVAATSCLAAAAANSAFVLAPAGTTAELQTQLRGTSAATAPATQAASTSSHAALLACGAAAGMAALSVAGRHARKGKRSTAVKAFENEIGVQPPIGFWDPAGLAALSTPLEFRRRRMVEIKHGRVAMLATIGYIVPEYFKFPGVISPSIGLKFEDIPTGLAAASKVPATGWSHYVGFCGLCDLFLTHQYDVDEPGKLRTLLFGGEVTNYEYGFLGIPTWIGGQRITDPELRKKKLNAELANGRLAMMAIIGMFFQDGLTGSAWGDWANYTDSPLRAFENALGAQPPVGFWDPLGFTKTVDEGSFRRRRQVELKHGRVAMLATLGYIVPEYFTFDGYLSPSLGLKFSDVPHGLGAFSVVPTSGWAQIISFLGYIELFAFTDDVKRAPGDFEGAGFLGIPNGPRVPDAAKAQKLSAELANGRLAMMAIIGMFFQDGLTGSAWGDWALYTDSPLRAIPPQMSYTGGPWPADVWDPAGLSKGASEQDMLRWRHSELKHGRVAMLAVLGWFHVAAGWHFVGDFANGERGSDDPLVALTQVPMAGMWQVIFGILVAEWVENVPCKPPAERPWDTLGWSDIVYDEEDEEWKYKQCQELNNGRLAMVAIVGLIAQDAYTGDYFAGIGKFCFGNAICDGFERDQLQYGLFPLSPGFERFITQFSYP